ncbi:39S ribosomal protein L51, mitochondrial isoform X2 [Electrophorus electricus]|nr:39S ribosomal protein L51, mitochondrial isoform X2 [Electrophorus electricus]XP_026858959.1 39S ribosomal protein L51, mitochondrial isoform X2 [Electrophorus electricus]
MAVFGGLFRTGVSLGQSSLLLCTRQFATGTCLCVRMHAIPKLKNVDRWTEKRSMFGVYDNIGILGDFKAHPKDLITGPVWLRGFRGHELQRLTRKKQMVGDRMMLQDRHNLAKRISFLYRRFNRYGKRR